MITIDENNLKNLLADYSRAIVGRICKQNEIITSNDSLSKDQALSLLKSFNRELIYESFRDLENQLKVNQTGKQLVKFSIYNTPTKK